MEQIWLILTSLKLLLIDSFVTVYSECSWWVGKSYGQANCGFIWSIRILFGLQAKSPQVSAPTLKFPSAPLFFLFPKYNISHRCRHPWTFLAYRVLLFLWYSLLFWRQCARNFTRASNQLWSGIVLVFVST